MITANILLASSFIGLHFEGGAPFMFPLLLMLLINLGIILYGAIAIIKKNQVNAIWLESIKQIGTLAAVWGTFSTIIGLIFAFNALENSTDVIPFNVICGGMKVALITVAYGLLIFCISLFAYIVFKLISRNTASVK